MLRKIKSFSTRRIHIHISQEAIEIEKYAECKWETEQRGEMISII